jgi:hypothetical protein
VPWAVAVIYLGEPLLDRHELTVGLVVMSQKVSTLERTCGAGSNSRRRTSASLRSSASMMAQE